MTADDTIVAIATGPGEAAIAVTRLSGPDALAIAARFFRGARSPLTADTHRILFGSMVTEENAPLDTVLLSVFRAPHSYTGDDVVEISSHGGPAVRRAILETLVGAGARPARPGEFTERAFRNGKLDLSQAEAVASIVRARSEASLRALHATLDGTLSRHVDALDDGLVMLLADVESCLDFPRDVGEPADVADLAERCASLGAAIADWLGRLPSARRREEGVRVAIVGAPNVGKSSLLNALVGYDRAIVNEAPGTTRDTVEASIWLDGVELVLTDTAGLRETTDPVERLGVERSERAAASADLTLIVRDASRDDAGGGGAPALGGASIEVWNKSDLVTDPSAPAVTAAAQAIAPCIATATGTASVATVAIRPGGVDSLIAALRAALPVLVGDGEGWSARLGIPATSLRQEALLRQAFEALERATSQLRAANPAYDLAAVDLTEARCAVGEMIGRGVDDAVVAAIFSRFCIGK